MSSVDTNFIIQQISLYLFIEKCLLNIDHRYEMSPNLKDIIIFTNSYPYGFGEQFIADELLVLSKSFETIRIIPLTYGHNRTIRPVPANVHVTEPLLSLEYSQKAQLFIQSQFMLRGFFYFISEFFRKSVFKNKKHLMNWLSFSSITKLCLAKLNVIEKFIGQSSILYFYWGDNASGIVPFIRKKYTNKIFVRFHGSDLYEDVKGGYLPFRSQLLSTLTCALFISKNGELYLKEKYKNIPFESEVIRLGVFDNGDSTMSLDGKIRILSCSNMIPLKRIHLIIHILEKINVAVEWTHIGSGPLLDELKNKTTQLGSHISVVFKGHIEKNEIVEFYQNNAIDFFLNVSETEGVPVSIMEALSFGVPVIATNVGGTSEIVDSNVGLLVEKDFDPSEVAQWILTNMNNSYYRINAKKQWASKCNADENYSKLVNLFGRS